jgi:tetratricopeptide (TPR) repeat protein
MSKTTLRTYNREIESLIEQNQFEQAIAHARHILQFFPKHIHTYRLLGKAYLESQRYGDAADVFQRVLSAIPDDFVSQVGMSIIREDEGNLDEAIWHMERAFEIQPANGAIQGELRRLYGRRDGMEPPKVRLTRGALARMYLKGELYQQAIAELRAALAEDPQRPDLLALLAQAYFMIGQRVEAADTCSALLKKTPYCLEANRILADILNDLQRRKHTASALKRLTRMQPIPRRLRPRRSVSSIRLSHWRSWCGHLANP